MSDKPNGGTAFPWGQAHSGMSMRDYFAAAVAPSITHAVLKTASDRIEERIANACYGIADAMIKKRSEHESVGLAQKAAE